MNTHRAVRDASRCQAFLIYRPDVPDSYDEDISALGEWLDLASFVLSLPEQARPPSEHGRRALYNDIIKCVRELERRGLTVLSGVMQAPQKGIPDWKVAIISVTSKLTDPGGAETIPLDGRPPRYRFTLKPATISLYTIYSTHRPWRYAP